MVTLGMAADDFAETDRRLEGVVAVTGQSGDDCASFSTYSWACRTTFFSVL
jgi:hypothetical protein